MTLPIACLVSVSIKTGDSFVKIKVLSRTSPLSLTKFSRLFLVTSPVTKYVGTFLIANCFIKALASKESKVKVFSSSTLTFCFLKLLTAVLTSKQSWQFGVVSLIIFTLAGRAASFAAVMFLLIATRVLVETSAPITVARSVIANISFGHATFSSLSFLFIIHDDACFTLSIPQPSIVAHLRCFLYQFHRLWLQQPEQPLPKLNWP